MPSSSELTNTAAWAANAGSHKLIARAQEQLLNYKDLYAAEVYWQ